MAGGHHGRDARQVGLVESGLDQRKQIGVAVASPRELRLDTEHVEHRVPPSAEATNGLRGHQLHGQPPRRGVVAVDGRREGSRAHRCLGVDDELDAESVRLGEPVRNLQQFDDVDLTQSDLRERQEHHEVLLGRGGQHVVAQLVGQADGVPLPIVLHVKVAVGRD